MNRILMPFLVAALLLTASCHNDQKPLFSKHVLPSRPPDGWSVVINVDMNNPRFCSYALLLCATNAVVFRGRDPEPSEQSVSMLSSIRETAQVELPSSVSKRIYSLACKLYGDFVPSDTQARGGVASYMLDMHFWPDDVVSIRRGNVEANTKEHQYLEEILSTIESQGPVFVPEAEENKRHVSQAPGESDEIYLDELVQEILALESERGSLRLTIVYTNDVKSFGRGEIVYPE